MGRQVRFYNYAEDIAPFDEFARDAMQAVYIRDHAPEPEPRTVQSLRLDADDQGMVQLLIARSADLDRLRWRHVEIRNTWIIDKDASPVVEYTPGYGRDGQPPFTRRGYGRMWFQTSRWEHGEIVRGDPEFVAWAMRMFRWIKRDWVLINGFYYSPRAALAWESSSTSA